MRNTKKCSVSCRGRGRVKEEERKEEDVEEEDAIGGKKDYIAAVSTTCRREECCSRTGDDDELPAEASGKHGGSSGEGCTREVAKRRRDAADEGHRQMEGSISRSERAAARHA